MLRRHENGTLLLDASADLMYERRCSQLWYFPLLIFLSPLLNFPLFSSSTPSQRAVPFKGLRRLPLVRSCYK